MTNKQFENIVEKYEKLVFTVCFRFTQDYHEAQNLTQETFVSAYSHIDSYDGNDYKPWLIRIASNKSKDFLKSVYSKRVTVTDDNELATISSDSDVDSSFIENESVEEIYKIIKSLKEPYHFVGVMFFIEKKSEQEISEALGRPLKTVKTQLYRCKLKLKEILTEKGIN